MSQIRVLTVQRSGAEIRAQDLIKRVRVGSGWRGTQKCQFSAKISAIYQFSVRF